MGFYLYAAIARIEDDATAERVVATATELARTQPALASARARRFGDPFPGVIVGFDPHHRRDELVGVFGGDEAAEEAAADAIEAAFEPLTRALPDHVFAIVEVECFGGACLYDGHLERAGEWLASVSPAHDGHQQLFARLGIANPPWFFPGFTRGFLDTGEEPAGPRRREVLCHAAATLPNVGIAPATLAVAALGPPWQITIANEHSLIVGRGDDLWLSLNAIDAGVELRASSHLEPAPTRTLIAELLDAFDAEDAELTITSTSSRGA